MTEGCTHEDMEARRAAFYAPPREDNVVTYYPGKKSPAPGIAYVTLSYSGTDGVARTAKVRTSSIEKEFYTWTVGGPAPIYVCKRDGTIIRTSLLQTTGC